MSQFDQIVKNIALENEKCNYNPKIDMNWCNLPIEMRHECVKWMGFRTRTRLSATSKTEKSLVEAKSHKIDQVRFYCESSPGEWTFEPSSETFKYFKEDFINGFVSSMFKNCEIENFWIARVREPVWDNERISREKIVKFAPFRFKRLSVFGNENLYFLMKNCENLEKVDYRNDYFGCDNKTLLELPSVLNVKEFRLFHTGNGQFMEFLNGLVQKWIDNDVEVGKSVQFVVRTTGIVNIFASKFEDRIIEKTEEIVRIRMDNEKSQILLRKIGSRLVWCLISRVRREVSVSFCSCKVVPIDMPESEYGKGDEWIQAVYEKSLERNGKLKKAMEFDAEDEAVWGGQHF